MTLEDIARSIGMPTYGATHLHRPDSSSIPVDDSQNSPSRVDMQVAIAPKIYVRYYPSEFDSNPSYLFTEEQVKDILELLESVSRRTVYCYQEISAQGHSLEFYFPERYRVNVLKVFLHRHGKALNITSGLHEGSFELCTAALIEYISALSSALGVVNTVWCGSFYQVVM